jgi:hypothetical protein
MRRLITLLIAAAVALLGGALAATPASAQVDPGTRTIALAQSFVDELTANNVTITAADGAVLDDSTGQLTITFPVTGDPTDGVVELGGTVVFSNSTSTFGMSDAIIDTTTGVVSVDSGGRLDVFTVAPTDVPGTWLIALNNLAAFGVNITFGTSFVAGDPLGTVAL